MDSTTNTLLQAHQLYSRSGGIGGDPNGRPPVYKAVGISLAIASGVFIGISFVVKKVGLLKANVKYNEEAGEGYGYLKNAWWWAGMSLMIVGEICNFVAYAFVDAILVTPMGALSVVITAILSAIFLKERLSFVGKVGCFNCIIGSVVIVINAPSQSAVANIQDMKKLVISPGFLSYAGVVIVACTVVAVWLGPKYGKKTMMVYIGICSMIGGLSVVATQGLGAAIVAQIAGQSQFKEWFLYVLFVFVITTLVTEVIYLNKALNLFNAALVTPTYYVFFTSSTIVTSAILFRGFKGTAATISTVIMGFLQICSGVVLLQLSKSAKDVPDTAVFKGDLDQVRTVAEQEEPEYEPRADTIRGGGAILRALSNSRTQKQIQEAKKLQEETMQPIGENERVEFDGIRRRRTVLDNTTQGPIRSGTIVRSKTLHPPLGMSRFPDASDDEDESDHEYHPGFFQRLRSRGRSTNTAPSRNSMSMSSLPRAQTDGTLDSSDVASEKGSYKHAMTENTSYAHHDPNDNTSHIHFAPIVPDQTSHHGSRHTSQDSLHPPRPPPHTAKRQFSFQNVFFNRHRADSVDDEQKHAHAQGKRPTSRSSRKSSAKNVHGAGTEEERLGLVKGDSQVLLPIPSHDSDIGDMGGLPRYEESPERFGRGMEEDVQRAGWGVGSGSGSRGDRGRGRRGSLESQGSETSVRDYARPRDSDERGGRSGHAKGMGGPSGTGKGAFL